MPIRNGARFVVPAVKSILEDEALGTLIIVDDGSNDDWEARAAGLLKRDSVRIIRQPPAGIAAALNRGLTEATTRYVARMDADDVSLPGRLASQIKWLDHHPEIAAFGAQMLVITADDTAGRESNYPCRPEEVRHALFARGRCALCHPAVMLRREAVLAAGGYRTSFENAEDYDLWLRLSEKGAVANSHHTFIHYRVHPGQVSHQRKVRQSFARDLALFSARERAQGRADPTQDWLTPKSYAELQAPEFHPVIRKLAVAYEAIDGVWNGGRQVLTAEAVRAIPDLARASYLGETRRLRYDLIKKAGATALWRGNLGHALEAYYALAHCRTIDSKFFRKTFEPAGGPA